MDIIKVVCGIIFNNDCVLICRRNQTKSLGGYWEFPGGKVEQNEDYESCLKRDLIEELNLSVEIESYFDSHIHNYERYTIELIAFIYRSNQNEIILNEYAKLA